MTDHLASDTERWPLWQKIGFRFFFVFFVLFILFNPNGLLPEGVFNFYIEPLHSLMVWMAAHILHLAEPITVFTNGSGDTTYDYLMVLFAAVLALVACIVWSAAGHNRLNHNKLLYWLLVVLRFYVGVTMLNYGLVKVIKLQFPAPGPYRLTEQVGDMSPMGLAWTYMGYSTGFNYFTGLAEVTCGLLLLFRRTATLGGLLGIVVAGNIMAINYGFDVPVKILSTGLTAMCLFIVAKDMGRLIDLLILNKPAKAINISARKFKPRWVNISMCVVKYVFIVYILVSYIEGDINASKEYGDKAPKPPFYGIYDVQSFKRNNDSIEPLRTPGDIWKRLVVNYEGYARITMKNDLVDNVGFVVDTVKRTIAIGPVGSTDKSTFTYTLQKPDILIMKGKRGVDSLQIRLKNFDLKNFNLVNRGFNWINEYPFNR